MPLLDESAFSLLRREVRTARSSPLDWLLLVGNRNVVASLLTLLFGTAFGTLVVTGTIAVDTSTSLLYLFQGLVAGNLTLLTIVLSVNQLVLSREFNAPGELEDRIRRAVAYRDSVRETTDGGSMPITPADFLDVLLKGIRERSIALREESGAADGQFGPRIEAVVADVLRRTERADEALEGAGSDVFSALAVALEINYSRELRDVRELRSAIDADDAGDLDGRLAAVAAGLKQVDVSRQYFKSLYVQSELARFSRLLLYVGIPSVAASVLLLTTYAGSSGPAYGEVLAVVVPAVVTFSFAPLALLFAFVLRVSMVAQRTVAVTPFTMAPDEKDLVEQAESSDEGSDA